MYCAALVCSYSYCLKRKSDQTDQGRINNQGDLRFNESKLAQSTSWCHKGTASLRAFPPSAAATLCTGWAGLSRGLHNHFRFFALLWVMYHSFLSSFHLHLTLNIKYVAYLWPRCSWSNHLSRAYQQQRKFRLW